MLKTIGHTIGSMLIMFSLMAIVFMVGIMITENMAKSAEIIGIVEIISEAEYDQQCPYEGAVIVNKAEREFLGKDVGVLVDCINYDHTKNAWITKDFDFHTNSWEKEKVYPKKDYDAFTMDGQLMTNAKGEIFIVIMN